jgi:predicted transcriptional regulator
MKTLEIKIMSREQAGAEFIKVCKSVQAGKRLPTVTAPQICFTSLEAACVLLTDERLKLLSLIRQNSPRSINHLAKISGRSFKNVSEDITLLKDCGFVKLAKRVKSSTTSKMISVPYQAINIQAVV